MGMLHIQRLEFVLTQNGQSRVIYARLDRLSGSTLYVLSLNVTCSDDVC